MAANKFATMLHRNTNNNRVVMILVYAVLEWILIFLLLVNSFLSFLISQFASYFGLPQPCVLCSRIDHHIISSSSPSSPSSSYSHLICEPHAKEILCSSSGFGKEDEEEHVERGKIDGGGGDCFCLGDGTEVVLKEEELFTEMEFVQNAPLSSSSDGHHQNDKFIEYCLGEDNSLEIIGLDYQKHVDDPGCEFDRLVPVELIDSSTSAFQDRSFKPDFSQLGNRQNESLVLDDDEEEAEEEEVGEQEKEEEEAACTEMSRDRNFERSSAAETITVSAAYSPAITEEDVVIEGEIDEHEEEEMIKPEDPPVQEEAREEEEQHDLSVNQVDEETAPFPRKEEDLCSENGEETEPANPSDEQLQSCAVSNGLSALHSLNPINSSDDSAAKNGDGGICHDHDHDHDQDHVPACTEPTDSWAEESLDGSIRSETESSDLVVTVEKLKTALKSERKALNAVYAELEEERNASAIAANQTMAMINRLQEEKAAMQMEALQYQRMMEEQSEYDQEALLLLNELMLKREKEKQELEKELDLYRKKLLDYDAKERLRFMRTRSRRSTNGNSSSEIDELSSIDLNREAKDELSENNPESSNDHSSVHHEDDEEDENINLEEIAMDCVKQMSSLDDSLAEFEDERLSILDQLKMLEEKLLSLNDGNEFEENGHDDYAERKTMGEMAKRLLPLLDAAAAEEDETEEGVMSDNNVDENSLLCRFDSKQLAIEDEVDHVYERLQALEADREFLKHCMSSIQKGDKGMDLLQEILQHLRDLRSVEQRVRSMSESPLS
ncbi:Myosin-binding protein 2 [Linum grandiflorum]